MPFLPQAYPALEKKYKYLLGKPGSEELLGDAISSEFNRVYNSYEVRRCARFSWGAAIFRPSLSFSSLPSPLHRLFRLFFLLICTASTPLQNRDGVTERTVNLKQKIYSRISK